MERKELNRTSIQGTVFVLLSAICFSLGGVLIKSIPWSSVTIQGMRSIFSSLVIGGFMLMRHQRFVWNKTVLLGAAFNTVMAFAFVAATKLTTAANAIVLQFTEPILVILLLWLLYKKKLGNMLAIFSGLTYALVMLMKGFMILLGVFQFGFSYVFLSKGLDYVSPVTASLTSAIEPILNPLLVAAFCGEMKKSNCKRRHESLKILRK